MRAPPLIVWPSLRGAYSAPIIGRSSTGSLDDSTRLLPARSDLDGEALAARLGADRLEADGRFWHRTTFHLSFPSDGESSTRLSSAAWCIGWGAYSPRRTRV